MSNLEQVANSIDSIDSNDSIDNALRSIGEELGEIYSYDSANPPLESKGARIVKVIQRGEGKSSKYVRVPSYLKEELVLENIDSLVPHIVDWLESVEDSIVKSQVVKGASRIYTECLGMDKILDKLESEALSNRLNGEIISNWYDQVLESHIKQLASEKLSCSITDERLKLVSDSYKGKLTSLASPKTKLVDSDRKALTKVLESFKEDEAIARRLLARLESMASKDAEVLLAL